MIALVGLLPAFAAPEPELVWVQAEDGGWLALHHQAGSGPPVLLCHGISSNHRFWDLAPGRSLADALSDRGFDVWNMDLRGHGDALHDPQGRRQRPGWSIDTYGEHDLPAAMSHVLAETGADSLHYVGHSMGGMVLAVYLANHGDDQLASAVAVASPLDFRDGDWLTRAMFRGAHLVQGSPFVPTQLGARYLSLAGVAAPLQLDALVLQPENYDPEAMRLTLRTVVSPISRGEIAQFLAMNDGEFRSVDGQRVYRTELGDVTLPMLFFAGRADHIVAPDLVWTYYESVGSTDKEYVLASRRNGFRGDYGHLDFGDSDHAADEVFPRIADWLEDHP